MLLWQPLLSLTGGWENTQTFSCFSFPYCPAFWLCGCVRGYNLSSGKEAEKKREGISSLWPPQCCLLSTLRWCRSISTKRSGLVEVQNAGELADPGTVGRYFSARSSYIDIARLRSAMVSPSG
jgi:hypothetical protein